MKLALVILGAAAAVAAATAAFAGASADQGAIPRQQALYGHIRSVERVHGRYRLRFDPAWWLTALAAERACGCKPVPNDYYVVDESPRTLTFALRSDARARILIRTQGPVSTASISVGELAQIVKGRSPRHRHLLMPKAGFWIRVGNAYPSSILALDQQYQP
jgi:hypothetical protein